MTCHITLSIPPKTQHLAAFLKREQATATNIQSLVHTSGKWRIPERGCILYATEEDIVEFVPASVPIHQFHYHCGKDFLEYIDENKEPIYYYVILSGNGLVIGQVQGTNRSVLHKWKVELPNKQGRGGQSKLRFERLVKEARANYVTLALERIESYLPQDSSFILAGNGPLKDKLYDRMGSINNARILFLLDLGSHLEAGFMEAIEQSKSKIQDFLYAKEELLLLEFFKQIDHAVYGWKEILDNKNELKVLYVIDPIHIPFGSDFTSTKELETFLKNVFGSRLVRVSSNTRLGTQLQCGFDGMGGLRFF